VDDYDFRATLVRTVRPANGSANGAAHRAARARDLRLPVMSGIADGSFGR
jgi:hypothetical protein